MLQEVTRESLESFLAQARVALLKFGAPWCVACHRADPALEARVTKLAEELREPEETASPTPHRAILSLSPRRAPVGVMEGRLQELSEVLRLRDDEGAARLLFRLAGQGSTETSVVQLGRVDHRATS